LRIVIIKYGGGVSRSKKPALRLLGAGYTYPAGAVGHPALAPLDLELHPGEILAVTGPNGSGKSTLLALLAGLIRPTVGRIEREGTPDVALVAQSTPVPDTLPITAAEVVAMGRWKHAGPWRRLRAADRRIISQSLETVALTELRDRPLQELSGGQRQRAFVAQGLARRASVLLLDEPMTALDADSRAAVIRSMREAAAAGTAVVLVTHDPLDAELADRTVHLAAAVPT
jgi:zinc/manganese transport system ATP-binding protein